MLDTPTTQSPPYQAPKNYDLFAGTETIKVAGSDVVVAVVTFTLSTIVVGLSLSSGKIQLWALLLHCAVLLIPAGQFALRQRHGGELSMPAMLGFATLAGGPVGAGATACTALLLWRWRPAPQRLHDWYDYIMGVVERSHGTRLYDQLSAGRAPVDPLTRVPHFKPILTGTSTEDQQRVLGVIGRRFHGDFLPILRLALRNRDGLIRAQAAAIASRLDLKEKALLWSVDDVPKNAHAVPSSELPARVKDAE